MATQRTIDNIEDRIEDAFECWSVMAEDIGDLLAYEYTVQYLKPKELEPFRQRLLKIGAKI